MSPAERRFSRGSQAGASIFALLVLVAILIGAAAVIQSAGLNYQYSPQSQMAQAASTGGTSDDASADKECPTPNQNQIYKEGSSCGETVQEGQSKKVNLYGCQCSGPLVKGICTRQNFCQGQQCFINGKWQSCGINTGAGEDTGTNVCAGGGCVDASGNPVPPTNPPPPSGLGDVSQLTPPANDQLTQSQIDSAQQYVNNYNAQQATVENSGNPFDSQGQIQAYANSGNPYDSGGQVQQYENSGNPFDSGNFNSTFENSGNPYELNPEQTANLENSGNPYDSGGAASTYENSGNPFDSNTTFENSGNPFDAGPVNPADQATLTDLNNKIDVGEAFVGANSDLTAQQAQTLAQDQSLNATQQYQYAQLAQLLGQRDALLASDPFLSPASISGPSTPESGPSFWSSAGSAFNDALSTMGYAGALETGVPIASADWASEPSEPLPGSTPSGQGGIGSDFASSQGPTGSTPLGQGGIGSDFASSQGSGAPPGQGGIGSDYASSQSSPETPRTPATPPDGSGVSGQTVAPSGQQPPSGGQQQSPSGGQQQQGQQSQGSGSGSGGGAPKLPQIPPTPPQQPQQTAQQTCGTPGVLYDVNGNACTASCSISVSPSSISAGQSATLSWSSQGAVSGSISNLGSVPASGAQAVTPSVSTQYVMNVQGYYGGGSGCATTLNVGGTSSGSAPTASLSCSPQIADVGSTLALSFSCSNSSSSSGSGFATGGQTSGSATTTIAAPPGGTNTATYALTCSNSQGANATSQCSVQVSQPSIVLIANPATVQSGSSSLLGWVTTGMQSCVISSPQDSDFTLRNSSFTNVNGTATTSPLTATSDYTLTCLTTGGQVKTAQTTVTVPGTTKGSPSSVSVSSTADGGVLNHGDTVTITWQSSGEPSDSAMSLWLVNATGTPFALIAGAQPLSGTYTWSVPAADSVCDPQASNVCGADLVAGSSYNIEADVYAPPDAYIGDGEPPQNPVSAQYGDFSDAAAFTVGQ